MAARLVHDGREANGAPALRREDGHQDVAQHGQLRHTPASDNNSDHRCLERHMRSVRRDLHLLWSWRMHDMRSARQKHFELVMRTTGKSLRSEQRNGIFLKVHLTVAISSCTSSPSPSSAEMTALTMTRQALRDTAPGPM